MNKMEIKYIFKEQNQQPLYVVCVAVIISISIVWNVVIFVQLNNVQTRIDSYRSLILKGNSQHLSNKNENTAVYEEQLQLEVDVATGSDVFEQSEGRMVHDVDASPESVPGDGDAAERGVVRFRRDDARSRHQHSRAVSPGRIYA